MVDLLTLNVIPRQVIFCLFWVCLLTHSFVFVFGELFVELRPQFWLLLVNLNLADTKNASIGERESNAQACLCSNLLSQIRSTSQTDAEKHIIDFQRMKSGKFYSVFLFYFLLLLLFCR